MSRIDRIAGRVAALTFGKPEGATKWGFDKMDFRSAANFARVLAAGGISALQEPKRGHLGEFIWRGSGIEVVTTNNPLTGEYYQPGRREPEQGYASYVGVEGTPDKVAAVVKAAQRHGRYEEESENARDFI